MPRRPYETPTFTLPRQLPRVAIVGRPNVGKSTLINRIIGQRRAIVDDQPGVTRDRAWYEADWCGHDFYLIDTGGIIPNSEEGFDRLIREQVNLALAEADVVLFLLDGKDGCMPADDTIAHQLRQQKVPVVLGVNKIDHRDQAPNIYEFLSLGLGEPTAVSAVHGFGGVGNLLDEIVKAFPAPNTEDDASVLPERLQALLDAQEKTVQSESGDDADDVDELEINWDALDDSEEATGDDGKGSQMPTIPKVALVGRPNVGKSSILNRLAGEERVIVSDIPGTTRDAVSTLIEQDDQAMLLVDTAGVRKKSKVDFGVELFSVDRTLHAMDDADVVLMVVDATEGINQQEKRLIEMSNEKGCGLILVINKWDMVKDKATNTPKMMEMDIRSHIPHANFAELLFVSAKTGKHIDKIVPSVVEVMTNAHRRVSTGTVNQVIREALALNPPPPVKNKVLNVLYATQARTAPPTFILFVNSPKCVRPEYERYLEKKLRENIEFSGTPIRIKFRAREKTR
jgi:GTP-binding protein